MDFTFLLKLIGALVSALAAWLGFKKFKAVVRLAQQTDGPKDAQPSVRFVYRWSGKLYKPTTQDLVAAIGNKEHRLITINEVHWYVPSLRLKWQASYVVEGGSLTLTQGQGVDLRFNPTRTLETIADSHYFRRFKHKLSIICGLHLVLVLRSGEEVSRRAPPVFSLFLANQVGFSRAGRAVVWLHRRVWP